MNSTSTKNKLQGTENDASFVDIGRIPLNRKRQSQGIEALKSIVSQCKSGKIKAVTAGAALSGFYVIFNDSEFFRIKNIPDTEAHQIIKGLGLLLYDSVESVKSQARSSLAQSDMRSNIV